MTVIGMASPDDLGVIVAAAVDLDAVIGLEGDAIRTRVLGGVTSAVVAKEVFDVLDATVQQVTLVDAVTQGATGT
jgi:hypothetical protein